MTMDDVYINDCSFYRVKDKFKRIYGSEELLENMLSCVYKCLSVLMDSGNIYFHDYRWLRCTVSFDNYRVNSLETFLNSSINQISPHNGSYRIPFHYNKDWAFIFHISKNSDRIVAYFISLKNKKWCMTVYFNRYKSALVTDDMRLKDIV